MNQTIDILCRAKVIYASAPSHVAVEENPDPGTHCVIFALSEAQLSLRAQGYGDAVGAFTGAINGENAVTFNAEHSTEEVLAAFDRAITAEGLRVPPLQRTERTVPVLAGQES